MKNPEIQTKSSAANGDVLEQIETFLEKNRNIFLLISIGIASLLCYLLFDARMSFQTDDSEYVLMAKNFLTDGSYPSYHGTLYPLMLALLMKIFGMKVVIFKFFSCIFMVAQILFFYTAFKGKVPYLVLFTTLIYLSINSYFLYFSSQTYTEAFTLCLQALAFIFFFNHIRLLGEDPSLKNTWKSWLMFGFFLLVLSITKNILIVSVGCFALYFLIYKEWMNAVLTVLSFVIFKLPYELLTRTALHARTTSQLDQVMLKDFYNPAAGNEDFPSGYIERMFENFNIFVSVQVYKVLGFRSDHPTISAADDASWLLTLLFAAALIFIFITLFRKNRYLIFGLLYAIGVWFASFTSLQTIWSEQWRLIIPYVPYVLIALLGAFWYRAKDAKQSVFKPVLIVVSVLFLLIQFPLTSKKISQNSSGLKHYLKGEMTYGVPDTYADFVSICDSMPSKLPANAIIATGKPGEAFVYSHGYKFERVPMPGANESADSVLANLKKQGITHLFADGYSRQVNADIKIIEKQYPQKLVPVLEAGPQDRPLALIEIKY